MKNLIYIGNKLSHKGKTVTSIETLGKFLASEGFTVKTASSKTNKVLRILDMLSCIFKYRKQTDFVLIDTYSTQNFYYAYLCSNLCNTLNLKYVPILHGGNLPERLKNNPKLSASIFKNAFVNIAPSEYTKKHFLDYNFTNIKVIPNSIAIENYKFKPREIEEIKLLWVRSFSKLYNPNLAIDVLSQLQKQGHKASLCMVGPENDGALQLAKDYAKSLHVEVKFTGKLPKQQWIALAKDYNVFINTTNFDNMPVSVIEAMALGLPIVTTNVGGIPYLITNKKNGLLVPPNTANAFVTAILELKTNKELLANLVSNSRKTVESFAWNAVKKLWIITLQ
ncbi:glycosyltransferase family 4 protein [Lacinutrix salivirga]